MTISSTINRKEYTGNGATLDFAFPYKFLANADLKVYYDGTLQTITTNYTLVGAGLDGGGTVSFLVAPATGKSVVILRDPVATQELDLVENDPLPAESVENALDKHTTLIQRLIDRVDRSLVVSDTDISGADFTVPTPVANGVILFNDTADALEVLTLSELGAVTIPIPVSDGGTGATSASSARTNLGATATGSALFTAASVVAAQQVIDLEVGVDVQAYDADTTKNDAANVFTQSQTLGAGASLIFEGSTADDHEGTLASADVTSDRIWTLPDKSGTVAMTSDITTSGITLGTAVASTSGTSIDFTSIPAGVKRLTVSFDGVSTNGGDAILIQIGDSGGVETSGYLCTAWTSAGNVAASTAGFNLRNSNTVHVICGSLTLTMLDSTTNTFVAGGSFTETAGPNIYTLAGSKSLSAVLDRVRITTTGGSNAFDAGKISIAYE